MQVRYRLVLFSIRVTFACNLIIECVQGSGGGFWYPWFLPTHFK